MTLSFFSFEAYLQEDINTDPILFGEVTVDDAKATPHDGPHFNWPRSVDYTSRQAQILTYSQTYEFGIQGKTSTGPTKVMFT